MYFLSKAPNWLLMQTNGDAASLLSAARLAGVGPDAAWNPSSLDSGWGGAGSPSVFTYQTTPADQPQNNPPPQPFPPLPP